MKIARNKTIVIWRQRYYLTRNYQSNPKRVFVEPTQLAKLATITTLLTSQVGCTTFSKVTFPRFSWRARSPFSLFAFCSWYHFYFHRKWMTNGVDVVKNLEFRFLLRNYRSRMMNWKFVRKEKISTRFSAIMIRGTGSLQHQWSASWKNTYQCQNSSHGRNAFIKCSVPKRTYGSVWVLAEKQTFNNGGFSRKMHSSERPNIPVKPSCIFHWLKKER